MSESLSSPFGNGSSVDLNACVGTNGGPYDFKDYALGYFQAANALGRELDEKRGLTELSIDVVIYPLLYLYRQGIELMLKHYIYDRKERLKNDREHDLKKLWAQSSIEMKQLLEPVFGKERLLEVMGRIEDFAMKMHTLDPRGEVMRFPEDPYGNLFLQDYWIVNVEPIYLAGQEVENIFYALVDGLSEAGEYWSED